VRDLAVGFDAESWAAHSRELAASGTITFESLCKRKDGGIAQVEVNANLIQFDGQSYTLALLRDIGERKRTEQVLAAREREFRTLAENSPDSIIRYDQHCRVVYLNPVMERTLTADPALMLGKTPRERGFLDRKVAAEYQDKISQVLASGQPSEIEIEVPAPSGESHTHHIRFVAERGEDGEIASVLAIGREVSTQRRLQQSHDQLRQLAMLREIAREDERKDIAYQMHEDIAQILAMLGMAISTTQTRYARNDPHLPESFQNMAKLAGESLRLVRGVVDSLRPTALNLGIVAALEWLAREFSEEHAIPCELYANEDEIELSERCTTIIFRIAEELLNNVIQHAQASRVIITLARQTDDYLLIVCDDGKGFNPEAPRNQSIGLIAVQEWVHLLGGKAGISSARGQGTTVKISIPVTEFVEFT